MSTQPEREALLRRRLEREHSARLAAEQIAEESSRALYLQGRALEESLALQRSLTTEVEALLAGLESFTSRSRLEEIVESLHRFLLPGIPHTRLVLALAGADTAREYVVDTVGERGGQARANDRASLPAGPGQLAGPRTEAVLSPDGRISGTRLLLPLRAGGRPIGTVALLTDQPDLAPAPNIRFVQALVDEAALALHNALLYEHASLLSTTDPLTLLLNRRGFDQPADLAVRVAIRHGRPLAVLMVDIDRFKRVNDRYGHGTGDEVLALVARACTSSVRSTDLVGRYGGEEFCLLLPETAQEEAVSTATRVRAAVAGLAIPVGEDVVRLTVSVGIAGCHGAGDSLTGLLGRADAALYASKRAGRDRATVWSPALGG